MTTAPNSPDRAIQSHTQDRLGRSLFVERLADALVDRSTQQATGVVIGITGEWGSGKTSILHLLTEELRLRHQQIAIVRFDPWLISGREDLTRQFLIDLFRAVAPYIPSGHRYVWARTALNKYLSRLSARPLGSWVTNTLIGWLSRKAPLAETKEALGLVLSTIKVPIIALIDELDRVQDDEILATARLIRSVADFPNISYVVAYDAPRIIQALGNGDEERGQSYLQKIIQIQIPIPVIFEDEVKSLYLAEFGELVPKAALLDERFNNLLSILRRSGYNTPRTIKNITGVYHVIARMVRQEADWIDLLGYSALVANAPQSVAYMRQNPDLFVRDSADVSLYFEREGNKRQGWLQQLRDQLPEITSNPHLWDLVTFLFPTLETEARSADPLPDSISKRRVLLTVLRLGLIPGAFSADELDSFLRLPEIEAVKFIQTTYNQGRWDALDERLRRWLAPTRSDEEIEHIFLAVCRAAEPEERGWSVRYGRQHRLCREAIDFISFFAREARFKSVTERVVSLLLAEGRLDVASGLVRRHFWAYGIFGREKRPHYDEFAFMTKEQVEAIAAMIGARATEALSSEAVMRSIYTGHPVFIAMDLGLWNTAAREKMTAYLSNRDALIAIALMFHTPEGTTERAGMDRILDRDIFVRELKKIEMDASESGLDEGTLVCLKIATRDDDWS